MKFSSNLICPLGKIPNVDIKHTIYEFADMANFKGEWFLIEKNFYKDLQLFDIEIGFEDGVFFKTNLNQTLLDINHFSCISYFDCENKTTYYLNDFNNFNKLFPEFIEITEEEILYFKMKYEDNIIFKDYK